MVGVLPEGGTNGPSSRAIAASVFPEYQRRLNRTPWKMGTLSAKLNRSDISSPTPCLTSSLVLHSFVVPLLIRTLTLVGLVVQIMFVSWWMVAHIFFHAPFCRNSFILIASSALSSPKASLSSVDRNSLCVHGNSSPSFLVLTLYSLYMVASFPTECCIGLLMPHQHANLLTFPMFLTFTSLCC